MTVHSSPDQPRPAAAGTADPSAAATADVVIPTRNRAGRIGPLVQKLLAEPGLGRLVVVDDGSTDGTAEVLAALTADDPRVVRVEGPRRGSLQARVEGVLVCTADIVVVLDDDVIPDPGLIAGHLGHHGAPDAPDLVLGYMPTRVPEKWDEDTFSTYLYAMEYEGRCNSYRQDPSAVLQFFWMGNFSIRRELFLDVTHRHPEAFAGNRHEDQLFGLRLRDTGAVAVFDESLRVVHEHHRTLAQFRADARKDGAGLAVNDRVDGSTARLQHITGGLPAPLSALVQAARRPAVHAVAGATLTAAVRTAAALGRQREQLLAARVLRRVDQHRGYTTKTQE